MATFLGNANFVGKNGFFGGFSHQGQKRPEAAGMAWTIRSTNHGISEVGDRISAHVDIRNDRYSCGNRV